MAIRPVDLQGAIYQSGQTAAVQRQSEEAPRVAQALAQGVFERELSKREETIAESTHATGNRVEEKKERDKPEQRKKRERRPGEAFNEDGGSEFPNLVDGEHIIDFTA